MVFFVKAHMIRGVAAGKEAPQAEVSHLKQGTIMHHVYPVQIYFIGAVAITGMGSRILGQSHCRQTALLDQQFKPFNEIVFTGNIPGSIFTGKDAVPWSSQITRQTSMIGMDVGNENVGIVHRETDLLNGLIHGLSTFRLVKPGVDQQVFDPAF